MIEPLRQQAKTPSLSPEIKPAVWFVAFLPASAAWYHRFLKPGWQHVVCFAPLNQERWVVIDALWTHMEVAIVDIDTLDRLVSHLAEHGTILKARVRPSPVRFRTLATCVTFAKHLVGDRSWAITPWQLYRSMRRNGAEKAFYRG